MDAVCKPMVFAAFSGRPCCHCKTMYQHNKRGRGSKEQHSSQRKAANHCTVMSCCTQQHAHHRVDLVLGEGSPHHDWEHRNQLHGKASPRVAPCRLCNTGISLLSRNGEILCPGRRHVRDTDRGGLRVPCSAAWCQPTLAGQPVDGVRLALPGSNDCRQGGRRHAWLGRA